MSVFGTSLLSPRSHAKLNGFILTENHEMRSNMMFPEQVKQISDAVPGAFGAAFEIIRHKPLPVFQISRKHLSLRQTGGRDFRKLPMHFGPKCFRCMASFSDDNVFLCGVWHLPVYLRRMKYFRRTVP